MRRRHNPRSITRRRPGSMIRRRGPVYTATYVDKKSKSRAGYQKMKGHARQKYEQWLGSHEVEVEV